MKKLVKIFSLVLALVSLFSYLTVFAHAYTNYYEKKSYLKSSTSFRSDLIYSCTTGKTDTAGYKYTNSSCDKSDAYFNVSIRKYKTEDSIFYSTVATQKNNPAVVSNGVYISYVFNKVLDSESYFYYYYQIKNNSGNVIYAKTFNKFQYKY
ncbi:MAG: hypothetical protein Q4C21_09035 [Oscillospiraceae bacterium]|nr:hypothetical protein [Oscillospiraceae bacterium]